MQRLFHAIFPETVIKLETIISGEAWLSYMYNIIVIPQKNPPLYFPSTLNDSIVPCDQRQIFQFDIIWRTKLKLSKRTHTLSKALSTLVNLNKDTNKSNQNV